MKITNDISREIYEQAKGRSLSNCEIAKKYEITEGSVRHHVKRWEGAIHEIAKNDQKVNTAMANMALNVQSEALQIIQEVKESLTSAKQQGVSPERLAPLYGNWIKSLELASEILGDIDRNPQTNIQLNQQFNTEYAELKSFVFSSLCPACKSQIISKGKLKEQSA